MEGCAESFAQQQALTRHTKAKHADENTVTAFYHWTVDGCKYSRKGQSRKFTSVDQAKEHIKDYGHYAPHSSNERPRRGGASGIQILGEHEITVYYDEWNMGIWQLRSWKYNSRTTRLWYEDLIWDRFVLGGSGESLACPSTFCYYSSKPPCLPHTIAFKSPQVLLEHRRRCHQYVPPEHPIAGSAST